MANDVSGQLSEEIVVESSSLSLRLGRLGPPAESAVLLVPGLGASPLAFSLHDRRSLVSTLIANGRSPWQVDFQLSWRSPRQDAMALVHALQAALAELRRHLGQPIEAVDAIGHSLGGILLLALAADGVPFRRLVTLASAVDFNLGRAAPPRALSLAPRGVGPLAFGPLKSGARRAGGLPTQGLASWAAPLWGRGLDLPIERDQFHPGTTPGPISRRMMREGVRDMPLALLLDLADLFSRRGLSLGPHGRALRDALDQVVPPVLMVAARQDRQCPLEAVRAAAARLPRGRLLEVGGEGRKGEGYGHVDLLTGSPAPEQVFDPITRFLDAADDAV